VRFVVYLLGGTIAFVSLHAALLMLHDPPDAAAERTTPRRLQRAPSVAGEATLLFAGDTAEIDAGESTFQQKGYEYPFTRTIDLIRDADVAIANAEAPLTDGGHRFPIYKDYTYRAPARSADALAWAGFDVLTLANNHTLDYGAEGLRDTIANAEHAGLTTAGAGADPAEARRAVVITIGDVRVGLLAYCEKQLLWRVYVDQFARRGHAGVAALVDDDLAHDIARLRPQVDVLIVSLHLGYNYQPPLPSTLRWSKRAIDLGADLVVDHHPHVAHPILVHHGKPILLSLGNYAFSTPGHAELDHGWLAILHLTGKRPDRLELVPLAVQNSRIEFRPEPLRDEELARALSRLRAESAPLGADVRIERGRGILYL
jgi:poly-gamma-glutamate capsule biosynthesis protein CapA/YwtB (metallophosphatase superfamily)